MITVEQILSWPVISYWDLGTDRRIIYLDVLVGEQISLSKRIDFDEDEGRLVNPFCIVDGLCIVYGSCILDEHTITDSKIRIIDGNCIAAGYRISPSPTQISGSRKLLYSSPNAFLLDDYDWWRGRRRLLSELGHMPEQVENHMRIIEILEHRELHRENAEKP